MCTAEYWILTDGKDENRRWQLNEWKIFQQEQINTIGEESNQHETDWHILKNEEAKEDHRCALFKSEWHIVRETLKWATESLHSEA